MRIGAGVLHYNFWPGVRETLDSLLAQTRSPDVLVLVDNGSEDGTANRIREAYPQVDVRVTTPNVGPTGGMNRVMDALLEHGVDALMLVPHDTKFAPDALERLASRLDDDPSLGAVAPVLGYASDPDRLWSAGGEIHHRNWDTGHPRVAASLSEARTKPPFEAAWFDGTGILMRAEAVRATGRYHEDFYYFFDEPDYHLRMRKLGWRLECVPAAAGWTDSGTPSPYLFVRNRLGFLARNAPRRFVVREILRVLFYAFRDAASPRPGGRRRDAWLRVRGLVDFLTGRWGPPPRSLEARRATD